MQLEFANKDINEFRLGPHHFKNDGKPFEVPDILGTELLNETAFVGTERVNVFQIPKVKKEK